jgi:hypothetical protein
MLATILAADVRRYFPPTGSHQEDDWFRLRAARGNLLDPNIAIRCGTVVRRRGICSAAVCEL